MKKILILLLISSVPLMSIAQKRSKNQKEQTTQSSSENVLIIKITEIIKPLSATRDESAGDVIKWNL